jgi:hypothetical protein
LAYVLDFARHPIGRLPWVDEGAYWARASAILGGGWLPDRPFFQDPLYPYFLAMVMKIVGPQVSGVRLALGCLGAVTPVLVYWAGRRGLGRSEGIVAGFLAALHGPLIFTDGLLEKEGLGALIAAAALVLTAWSLSSRIRVWRFLLVGFAWGILALLRANALALAPVGALWLALKYRSDSSLRLRLARASAYFLGFTLAIAPVTVVNAIISRPRDFVLTTWQGGPNFYIGNGPEATGTYSAPEFVEANPAREADDFAAEAVRQVGHALRYSEVSRYWFRQGLSRWRTAPRAAVRLLLHKFGLITHNFEIPDNHDIAAITAVAAPRLTWGFLNFGSLLPLAALGLARHERTAFWGFLVLSSATGIASTALFFVVGRYRIPWVPGLALLAAAGITDVARRWMGANRMGAILRIVFLVAPVAALSWRPMADPTPERFSHAEIELAMAYLAEGRLEPTINALDDARALSPGAASRVEAMLSEGPVHDRLAALVHTQVDMAQSSTAISPVEHARWFRQFPETRKQCGADLQALVRAQPRNAAALRELGAWWLGEVKNAQARIRAREELTGATQTASGDTSAGIILALLTANGALLPPAPRDATTHFVERLRLAHAIARQQTRTRP